MIAAATTRRSRVLNTAVGAAALTGAGALAWQAATLPIDTTPIARAGAQAVVAAAAEAPGAARPSPPLSGMRETLARPVFSPTRRPFEAPPPPPAEPPAVTIEAPPEPEPDVAASAEALRVIGIIQREGARRVLVRAGEAAQGVWVAVGEEIAGWRVAKIDAAGITVEARGRTVELKLYPR